MGLISGLGRSPGGGHGNPFMPGESHGQKSLVGYGLQSCNESDTTEVTAYACIIVYICKDMYLYTIKSCTCLSTLMKLNSNHSRDVGIFIWFIISERNVELFSRLSLILKYYCDNFSLTISRLLK